MLMNEKLLHQANLMSFLPKIVQMGALQSCQILYKPLQFCGLSTWPNPYKLSILGDIWTATILPFSSSKYFYSW